MEERKELWSDLCHQHNSSGLKNKALLIMGNFNEILEGSGFGNTGRISSGMRYFERAVLHCQLADMSYQGQKFTWCNKKEEGVICKKLDRVLLNNVALLRFTNAYSVFYPGDCSDHMHCKIQIWAPSEKIRRPFKFVNAISNLLSFLPMVKEYLDGTKKLFHSTSVFFRFSKKLKNLKPLIRKLGREKLGNLTKRANEAYEVLCNKQQNTL